MHSSTFQGLFLFILLLYTFASFIPCNSSTMTYIHLVTLTKIEDEMKEYNSIKVDSFTYGVLKDAKALTGIPISRIIADLMKKEYPNKYKGEMKR